MLGATVIGSGPDADLRLEGRAARHAEIRRDERDGYVCIDLGSEAPGRPSAGYFRCAIWIRFPQVSSNTAVVTGPISAGSWVNRTPSCSSRVNSAATSSTAKDV